jgi:hypothetical protein
LVKLLSNSLMNKTTMNENNDDPILNRIDNVGLRSKSKSRN